MCAVLARLLEDEAFRDRIVTDFLDAAMADAEECICDGTCCEDGE